MIYNQLKSLNSNEIRAYIKDHVDNDSFLNELLDHKESLVPFLLSHKAMNDDLLNLFLKDEEKREFICDQLIEAEFTPSLIFIESLINTSSPAQDAMILKLIKKFESIPLKIEHLFLSLNQELIQVGTHIFKKNPSFSEPRILKIFIKLKTDDFEIVSKIFETKDSELTDLVLMSVFENRNEKLFNFLLENYFAELIAFGSKNSLYNKNNNFDILLENYNLSPEQWKDLNRHIFASSNSYFGSLKGKRVDRTLLYSPELEDSYDILKYKNIDFHNEVPEESKFRKIYVTHNPSKMNDSELLKYIVNSDCPISIVFHTVQNKNIDLIKKINIDALERVNPAGLRDSIRMAKNSKEISLYLLEHLSSRYTAVLRLGLSSDEADAVKGRKKSYFSEILNSISKNDFDEFKKLQTYGYSLEQFCKDSFQKTKAEESSRQSIKIDFLSKLEKEELLTLAKSNLRFESIYDEKNIFSFFFNKKELEILKNKISLPNLFPYCETPTDLIAFCENDSDYKDNIGNIFDSNFQEIISNPPVLKKYLTSSKRKIKIHSESYIEIAKHFSKDEMLKYFTLDYGISSIFLVRDKNNAYIFNIKDILEEIKSNNSLVEENETLSAIKEIDFDFYEKTLVAYLDGNKAMTELFGFPVKISRKKEKISHFEFLLKNKNVNNEEVVDEICVSNNFDFYSIERAIQKMNLEKGFEKYSKNKTFKIQEISDSSLIDTLKEFKQCNFNIEQLTISIDKDEEDNAELSKNLLKNCNIAKVCFIIDGKLDEEKFLKFYGMFPNSKKSLKNDYSNTSKVFPRLCELNIDFEEKEEYLKNLRSILLENGGIEIEFVDFYEKNGIIFDKELLTSILDSCTDSDELKTLEWIIQRVGDLSFYEVNKDDIYDEEVVNFLAKNKAIVLDENEYDLRKIIREIKEAGKITEAISISQFSLKQKKEIISFVENLEPAYKKLNLTKDNLEELDSILPINEMVTLSSYSDSELCSLFNIAKEISSNKKILQSLKDLIMVKGVGILYKQKAFNNLVKAKGHEKDLNFSDTVDYSDVKNLFFEAKFLAWNTECIEKITGMDLTFNSKKDVIRFLNSLLEHDERYLNDIEGMSNRITNELVNLRYRLNNVNLSEEEKSDLKKSIEGIESRLIHVKGLDHAEHVHDRLVTLSGFIKEDPLQLIGQDKYSDLESEKVSSEFGYRLVFPKNRSEVQELGNTHGWCVSANSGYADGVISKNNILVAIAPKSFTGDFKEIIALAHFTHRGNNKYSLEQFRWSKIVKGKGNVDAKSNFDYLYLISLIESHLESIKKKK